jgi:hypothetical protein
MVGGGKDVSKRLKIKKIKTYKIFLFFWNDLLKLIKNIQIFNNWFIN